MIVAFPGYFYLYFCIRIKGKTALIPQVVFLQTVPLLQYSLFVRLWFHMWRLCCPYFSYFSYTFGAFLPGRLYFVIMAFPGYLHLYFVIICSSTLLHLVPREGSLRDFDISWISSFHYFFIICSSTLIHLVPREGSAS